VIGDYIVAGNYIVPFISREVTGQLPDFPPDTYGHTDPYKNGRWFQLEAHCRFFGWYGPIATATVQVLKNEPSNMQTLWVLSGVEGRGLGRAMVEYAGHLWPDLEWYASWESEGFHKRLVSQGINHVGRPLDKYVAEHWWCQLHGIKTGADYLRWWAAALVTHPEWMLPFLAIYRDGVEGQNTGKSFLYRSLEFLFERGATLAGSMLMEKYNGQIVGSVLCGVEDINLAESPGVMEKIKKFVESKMVELRIMFMDPVQVANCTHWIYSFNGIRSFPLGEDDSRCVVWQCDRLDPIGSNQPNTEIPREELSRLLKQEAPAFLATLLEIGRSLPPPRSHAGRLFLPVLQTEWRAAVIEASMDLAGRLLRVIRQLAVDGKLNDVPTGQIVNLAAMAGVVLPAADPTVAMGGYLSSFQESGVEGLTFQKRRLADGCHWTVMAA
jgi:Family of unknown function (DUF5906)